MHILSSAILLLPARTVEYLGQQGQPAGGVGCAGVNILGMNLFRLPELVAGLLRVGRSSGADAAITTHALLTRIKELNDEDAQQVQVTRVSRHGSSIGDAYLQSCQRMRGCLSH